MFYDGELKVMLEIEIVGFEGLKEDGSRARRCQHSWGLHKDGVCPLIIGDNSSTHQCSQSFKVSCAAHGFQRS
jgi:hypothetical protein